MSTAQTQLTITLSADAAERLAAEAQRMGLGIGAYVEWLMQKTNAGLGHAAQDAAKFMFSTQGQSLRKLAQ